ncbi:MAG: hypothetical protein ABI467_11815 [Kofleriaceae bacterium]
MSFGIVEIISLLLSLGGLGLSPNPKPPTVDASLQYGVPDADLVVHFDAASVVPGNFKVLEQLPVQPEIQASPELARAARQLVNEVEGPRNMAKGMIGFDPVNDLSDVTAFVKHVANAAQPAFVVVAHGKFTAAMLDKIAKLTGKLVVKRGAASLIEMGDGNAVALAKDGALLAGAAPMIEERIAESWRAPSHAAGTNLGQAATMLAGHPVFGISLTVSQAMRQQVLKEHPEQNFLTDLVRRGHGSSFALYRDGIGWTFDDSTAAGLAQMAMFSDGVVDVLRAAQIAPRGFAKIAIAALDSYKGLNPQVDALIAHKADLDKLTALYTGDGQFKAKIQKDPRTLKLNVRLTGKSLSDVVPVGVIVPMAAIGVLFASRTQATVPVPAATAPAQAPPPVRKPGHR